MVVGPIVLLLVLLAIFGRLRIRSLEREYGIEMTMGNLINSVQMLNETTTRVWEEMTAQAEEDTDEFLRFSYLQHLDEELESRLSFLVLVKDGKLYYQGNEEEDLHLLLRRLPPYGSAKDDDKENGVYIGGRKRAMVKQIDLDFSDGSRGSAYIVTTDSAIVPQLWFMLMEVGAVIVIVLVITGLIMTLWINNGINRPIRRLQEAARRITQGDLDFTLEAEGKDEISDLTRDFETMRRQLVQTEELKRRYDSESRELISNISHDLKTPVTTIKGYVEGIMDGVADTPEKMDRYIRTIYSKANEMDRLINELTFYSRIDTNRIPYHFTRLNVYEYFNDCAEELKMEMDGLGIQFTYEYLANKDTLIIADPEQLMRVISNIVGNSVKYIGGKKGEISLRVLDVGDLVQVELEDNGPGIATEDLAAIFDRFYRTDESRSSSTGGSGIGLSIVKKIIEDHGGKIWASSQLGHGTTMHFVLRKYST